MCMCHVYTHVYVHISYAAHAINTWSKGHLSDKWPVQYCLDASSHKILPGVKNTNNAQGK